MKYIKFEKKYGGTGNIGPGMPYSTTVEIILNSNNKTNKRITHTFYSLKDLFGVSYDSFSLVEELENAEELFAELERLGINECQDSYAVDTVPEMYSGSWVLTYLNNDTSKLIYGSNANKIEAVDSVKELIGFEDAENKALENLAEKIEEARNYEVLLKQYGIKVKRFSEERLSIGRR